ncbi:hypothetical protein Cadr_000021339 [Camelus dromedarius]|uniref:Uncharacterized protein n=1 Tax=Camelus dromedarius TaxID=9838 RepID=A0A5N4CTS1_CAMDR|nr:hypothetical protein Cadr_000021339 [Camelus dromedarius]
MPASVETLPELDPRTWIGVIREVLLEDGVLGGIRTMWGVREQRFQPEAWSLPGYMTLDKVPGPWCFLSSFQRPRIPQIRPKQWSGHIIFPCPTFKSWTPKTPWASPPPTTGVRSPAAGSPDPPPPSQVHDLGHAASCSCSQCPKPHSWVRGITLQRQGLISWLPALPSLQRLPPQQRQDGRQQLQLPTLPGLMLPDFSAFGTSPKPDCRLREWNVGIGLARSLSFLWSQGWPPNNSHLWKLIIGDEREVQRVDLYQIIHLAAQVTPGRESIIVRPPVRVGRGWETRDPERENDWSKVIQQPLSGGRGFLVPHPVLPAGFVRAQGSFEAGVPVGSSFLEEKPHQPLGEVLSPTDVVECLEQLPHPLALQSPLQELGKRCPRFPQAFPVIDGAHLSLYKKTGSAAPGPRLYLFQLPMPSEDSGAITDLLGLPVSSAVLRRAKSSPSLILRNLHCFLTLSSKPRTAQAGTHQPCCLWKFSVGGVWVQQCDWRGENPGPSNSGKDVWSRGWAHGHLSSMLGL